MSKIEANYILTLLSFISLKFKDQESLNILLINRRYNLYIPAEAIKKIYGRIGSENFASQSTTGKLKKLFLKYKLLSNR